MPIKSTTTTEGQGEGKRKKSKIIYRTRQKIRIINVFLESLLSESSLAGSHSPPHLPRRPSNTVLISGGLNGMRMAVLATAIHTLDTHRSPGRGSSWELEFRDCGAIPG